MLKPIFLEIIMAPSFTAEALDVFSSKKNLRLLEIWMDDSADMPGIKYTSVNGGLLAQDRDASTVEVVADQCVTKAKPSAAELSDMNFAWKIVKNVKSNAIVVAGGGMTYGVGAGQMNRVGSAEIALKEAEATLKSEGKDIREAGLVLASDGFFPFDDCVSLAAEYGIKAIVQPGGSVRDADSVAKADEKGISMLFTHERHFKH